MIYTKFTEFKLQQTFSSHCRELVLKGVKRHHECSLEIPPPPPPQISSPPTAYVREGVRAVLNVGWKPDGKMDKERGLFK